MELWDNCLNWSESALIHNDGTVFWNTIEEKIRRFWEYWSYLFETFAEEKYSIERGNLYLHLKLDTRFTIHKGITLQLQ